MADEAFNLSQNELFWAAFTADAISNEFGVDFVAPEEYLQYEPEVKKLFISDVAGGEVPIEFTTKKLMEEAIISLYNLRSMVGL